MADNKDIKWERLHTDGFSEYMDRCAVPGGWLIKTKVGAAIAMVFLPDPDHKWDGNSLTLETYN